VVGRSKSWVKKWLHCLRHAAADNEQVLYGQSRARKQPPPKIAPEVEERILDIRDHPPDELGRRPGPLTIRYYLHRDETLKARGYRLPRSSRTIWEILDHHQRIIRPRREEHEPEERPAPGVEWGMDFKDVSSVPAEPQGKQQHVVEILNLVDHGTSEVVASVPKDDYTAETALRSVAEVFMEHGCPERVRLDRDTRWVGSWTGRDFPAPVLRFLMCLGIQPRVCPPQRPDKNPFVERYHRNLKYECLLIHLPENLAATIEVNQRYVHHYNFERPNQAITCENQPPRLKFPQPPQLPKVPETIDPDRWLAEMHGKTYKRRLSRDGRFQLGNQTYYVQKQLHGRYILIWIDGQQRELSIFANRKLIKKIPIKGLQNRMMNFPEYLDWMCQEAVSD